MIKMQNQLALLAATGCFDEVFYLENYPDVAALDLAPAEHYLRVGVKLLRKPSEAFDTAKYYKAYPELETTSINPLVHYAANLAVVDPELSDIAAVARTEVKDELRTIGGRRLKGFLDRLNATGISGWAVDRGRPGKPVELAVYVDGEHLMDIMTSISRKDVSAAGMNGEKAGFSINWPAGLLPAGAVVDVRHKTFDMSLSRSPQTVESKDALRDRHIRYLEAHREERILPTTVVVPIYNAYDAVKDCLASLEENLSDGVVALLVNDCSSDIRIAALLEQYVAKPQFRVHHNPVNIGYTRSVNNAISMCSGTDVVLLNSDTVVTKRWLENLRYCAYSDPRVATVTAFSDNAGAFSMPEIGVYNPLPGGVTQEQFALAITNVTEGRLLEVPTGNGFCLFIRRDALKKIGVFDEERFPRGYGEENDFCMRALRQGWKNIVCDKAYVFHKRSQSFQGEKAQLMEDGARAVDAAFPEYRMLTQRFRDAEFSLVRSQARSALQSRALREALPRAMYVISTQTGGTPQTNMDLMRAMHGKYECYLLHCDSRTIKLSVLKLGKLTELEVYSLAKEIDPITHRSDEYDRVVLDILYRHSITLLHIRHIGWHSMGLSTAAKSLNIPVIYSSHDFYAICPSLNLLDNELKYCGGKCTPGEGTCQIALWPAANIPSLKHRFIVRWQEMFREFLRDCDEVITTAPSARDILLTTYPEIAGKFRVIPHGREFSHFTETASDMIPGDKIRVLVPGNISLSKGAQLIKDMAALDTAGRIEFHFLGDVWPGLIGIGVHHGKYIRESFGEKVEAINAHLGVVLSIWPETYCHTLTEMWACGVPVLGFDVGAVGDRLRASGAGWPVPLESTPAEVYQAIIDAAHDRDDYSKKLSATRAWQQSEGIWNDTGTMAVEYRRSYRRLSHGRTTHTKSIGVLIKGINAHPATAHIRVLRPLAVVAESLPIDVRPVTASWILAGGGAVLDGLVIQRDAVPPHLTTELITFLRERNLPFIYEVDDWLWNLPVDHTDHQIDEEQKNSMLRLAQAATLVTVSTPKLASILEEMGCAVELIPNAPDEKIWLTPLSQNYVRQVGELNGLETPRKKILYMGTRSHAEDLKLIAPAVAEFLNADSSVELIQIGGGFLLPGAREIVVPNESSGYADFVIWFRAVCTYMSAAIAPLRDDEFNSAKSHIKALDYGCAKLPAIYSNVGPYRENIVDGVTGLLCDNTSISWYDALVRLMDSPGLRASMGRNSYETANQQTLAKIAAPLWQLVLMRTFKFGDDAVRSDENVSSFSDPDSTKSDS